MSKLGHYQSTETRKYSNIEMDNGDLCFIYCSGQGVIVKKGKQGFFGGLMIGFSGKKIYEGKGHRIAKTMDKLQERYSANLCPNDMNLVLRVFTNAGLHCQSSDEFEKILSDD
tara:strand:+ start:150 stop:488 length:339 start_codon:yes stop_codon:yes gene_type:complete